MNLGKINHKKSLKLVVLMLGWLLIATASATVYRYMYIDGSITVGGAEMVWILGDDAPGDASIAGSTATIDLDVEQGTPINFTECLYLKNNGTSGSVNYNITMTSAVSSGDFERAKMHIYENYTTPGSWIFLNTFDLTDSTDYYAGSLSWGNYTRMTFEVNATIATGSRSFDIQVEY